MPAARGHLPGRHKKLKPHSGQENLSERVHQDKIKKDGPEIKATIRNSAVFLQ